MPERQNRKAITRARPSRSGIFSSFLAAGGVAGIASFGVLVRAAGFPRGGGGSDRSPLRRCAAALARAAHSYARQCHLRTLPICRLASYTLAPTASAGVWRSGAPWREAFFGCHAARFGGRRCAGSDDLDRGEVTVHP